MHYHNVFLVKAKDKAEAKKLVEKFLEPFYEELPVEVDEEGYPYNPQGEWDWYQFGGRWMWSDLIRKNIDKIVKPGTNFLWNPYYDEEVKGKTWTLQLPDGSTMGLEYGDTYPIRSWVHEHAELSEIIDATNPRFFEILEGMYNLANKVMKEHFEWAKRYRERGDEEMAEWAERKGELLKERTRWTIDTHFWNITENRHGYDIDAIKADPKHWFLVNVDLHH